MTKYLICFGLISFLVIGVKSGVADNEIRDTDNVYMGVQIYDIDRECAMVGGLCVHKDDCLSPTSKRGLCPLNHHRGVECCYELPIKAAPCAQHLGECMSRCNRLLTRPATDCFNGDVCCVLV